MAFRQAAIGADVRTSDGKSVGKVHHLIFDTTQKRLDGVVADEGIFDSGRVVHIEYVESMTEDVVTLKLTEAQAESLPKFVTQQFVQFGDSTVGGMRGGMVNVSGTGGTWMHVGSSSSGMAGTGSGSLFQPAIIGEMNTMTVGPLTDSDVAISNDTHVETLDGKNIGNVDDILFGEDGSVTGIIIEQGRVFHHDVHIPAEWIAGVTHERVRLSVTKDQVEASRK